MKILFACGGTAGHINPALAIADLLKKLTRIFRSFSSERPRGWKTASLPAPGT